MSRAEAAAFPFSAVVGQEELKLALLLGAIEPSIGGVLLRGQKGSGKTTVARALAGLLPGRAAFVELPVGATEDRVVGTLDLKAALTEGERRLHPGLLWDADGGVLYVDEVNLLPDHLVDVLLDVAASGVNRVQREGVSESHPSRFVLVGSMNPEEGELRPQLLDRFGLSVDCLASDDVEERAAAVQARIDFDSDPAGFAARWAPEEGRLHERLAGLAAERSRLGRPPADVSAALLRAVSGLCVEVGAEGLRADLVICRGAAALAAWEGRGEAGVEDVRRVAPLALSHRRRRGPFEEPGIDEGEIEEALDRARGRSAPPEARSAPGEREEPDPSGRPGGGSEGGRPPEVAGMGAPTGVAALGARRGEGGTPAASGRRGIETGGRGRTVSDREAGTEPSSLAVGPTVAAAAVRRAGAGSYTGVAAGDEGRPQSARRALEEGDLREAVREGKVANLVVLAVDSSGSMGAGRRMEAAKTAVLSLLLDAYQRRDRVAMVTFGGQGARVVLRPTGSVEVARARLSDLPTGGRTPLAEGIDAARRLAESARPGAYRPFVVLVSDGRATAGPSGVDPVRASLEAANRLRARRIDALVVDAEEGSAPLGLAGTLAAAMGARCLTLGELSGPALAGTLRRLLPDR